MKFSGASRKHFKLSLLSPAIAGQWMVRTPVSGFGPRKRDEQEASLRL
jgi:hypothetical protein